LVHPDYPLLRAPRGLLVPFSLPAVAFTLARRALDIVADSLRTRLSRGTRVMGESESCNNNWAKPRPKSKPPPSL